MPASSSPFLIFGLPRSRTAWLSRFLTYGEWVCGHEELRHMRGLDDIAAWFSQPFIGSAETVAAPFWRLIPRFATDARIVVVRRPVAEVVDSLMALGIAFDRAVLEAEMARTGRKLDQIVARVPNVLEVAFADLADEATCARVFEHCLQIGHDHEHWASLEQVNVQCDMRALMRYAAAYKPALDKLTATARHRILADMARQDVREPDGITFQTESVDSWMLDGSSLFEEHCAAVGEDPREWMGKNWPLFRRIEEVGAMQITTARCNGRMFGYLMTLIAPSLTSENIVSATNTTFFADKSFPGLGMKLQRESLARLRERGVNEVVWECGKRGDGPRLGAMYRRLGAEEHGRVYRLELAA